MFYITIQLAEVVKLVDALDSKSSGLYVHAGSIPALGTRKDLNAFRSFFYPPFTTSNRFE